MCRQFEEVLAMGEAMGEARGRAEEKERSILSVLNHGVSEEETARLLDLAIEEVRQAAARQKAASASLQPRGRCVQLDAVHLGPLQKETAV